MALTLDTFSEVLQSLNELSNPSRRQLEHILEGRTSTTENPYSLREIADFLVGVDEYIDGAADLAEELAELASEAGIRSTGGGTKMPRKRKVEDEEEDDEELVDDGELEEEDEEEEEEEVDEDEDGEDEEPDDEEEEEEDEEEKPKRKRASKKAKPKKAAAKKKAPAKKAKPKSKLARNTPVPTEERVPAVLNILDKAKDGLTINELYNKLGATKANAALFPTRRSVKRVLTSLEDEEFERTTSTVWQVAKKGATKKPKAKVGKTEKTKKGATKKRPAKKGAAKKRTR